MKYEYLACGGCFEDRLAHAKTCLGPFPKSWWHEDIGDVLWWCWEGDAWRAETPYVGSPLDRGHPVHVDQGGRGRRPLVLLHVGGWPGYHTHWTRLPEQPPKPGGGS